MRWERARVRVSSRKAQKRGALETSSGRGSSEAWHQSARQKRGTRAMAKLGSCCNALASVVARVTLNGCRAVWIALMVWGSLAAWRASS